MFSNGIISNIISLILRDTCSNTDSENVSLIQRFVSDDQMLLKDCVIDSLIDI